MKVVQVINKMHRRYAGDIKYPPVGSDEWSMSLEIINDLKQQWATDEDHQWSSCFEERTFGTTDSADTTVLQYVLDADVVDLSDFVYIQTIGGSTRRFPVIKEKDRRDRTNRAFISGDNPKNVNFTNMPPDCLGGTILAGIYFEPPDVKNANDTVPVDRPIWVILAGAAELAFNDPSKEDKFPDLQGLANDEYQKMCDAADTLPGNQNDPVPTVGFMDAAGGCD